MRGGTIHINSHFDDNVMAETIEKAMRSGDKEKVVLQLLQINNIQRQMLRTPYKTRYGKDLEEAIAKALGGDLEKLALSLMNTVTKEDAVCLQTAVKGLGTDEKVLNEIISTRTNEELAAIRNTYLSNYKRTLDEAVAADTSGDYKKLLLTLLQGIRDEGHHADSVRVRQAIDILSAPAEKKDKHEKYAVLGAANFHELAQILDGVQKKTGKSLEEQIKKECSGDFKEAVIVLYRIASMGKPRFFADQINAAVKGFGTNSKDLIRILVSRSEIDLEDIKDVYAAVHGKRLDDTIKEECKGAYQHALLELVRGNKSLA
ncbi:nex-3 [Pristionchus pacificus]|nr:nex-3 [Pristionchus pacificus]